MSVSLTLNICSKFSIADSKPFTDYDFSFLLTAYSIPNEQLNSQFLKLSIASSALLFTCLNDNQRLQIEIFEKKAQDHVWNDLLDHIASEISEWSLWILFLALKRPKFIPVLYTNTSNSNRLLLIDICLEFIDDCYRKYSESSPDKLDLKLPEDCDSINQLPDVFPEDYLTFFRQLFKTEIDFILQNDFGNIVVENKQRVRLTCKLSHLILKLSSMEIYRNLFQDK